MVFATLCVSVLLFVLLGVINGVNFTMASQDADQLTKALKKQHGAFESVPEADAPDLRQSADAALAGMAAQAVNGGSGVTLLDVDGVVEKLLTAEYVRRALEEEKHG